MTARRTLTAALAAFALAAAGCGGSDGGDASSGGPGKSATPASGPGQTFATTCGGCHTLAAADTRGQVGPNLDDLRADEQTVRTAIEQGPGVMPENLLEGAEADEVAAWVAENAGK